MTIGEATHDKLRRAQDLLRHVIPDGDLAAVFDRALTLLVTELEKRRVAKRNPRTRGSRQSRKAAGYRGRYVPAEVRRVVWTRDGGRCTFVGPVGRCAETGCLEFHHVVPYARGGDTTVENLTLRCRAHNQHEAVLSFGKRVTGTDVPAKPRPSLVRERRPVYVTSAHDVTRFKPGSPFVLVPVVAIKSGMQPARSRKCIIDIRRRSNPMHSAISRRRADVLSR